MKSWLSVALTASLFIAYGSLTANVTVYDMINPAQEKVRITLTQIDATFSWIDTIYAARERYYLSGIALEYIRKQKEKFKANKESYAILEQLEEVTKELHCLWLSQKDFESVRCKAQNLIATPKC